MNAIDFIKTNKVMILKVVGYLGIGATAGCAFYAGTKMKGKLIEADKECEEKKLNPKKDKKKIYWTYIKKTAPVVAPAVGAAVATCAAFGMAGKFEKQKVAALAGMAASYSKALKETKKKIKEVAGDEIANKVDQAIYQEKADKSKVPDDIAAKNNADISAEEAITAGFKQLFFDDFTGNYFRSTIDDIRKAERNMYKQMQCDRYGYAELDGFLISLGCKTSRSTANLGFYNKDYLSDKEDIIDLSTSIVAPSGQPAIVMHYAPKLDMMFIGEREVPAF